MAAAVVPLREPAAVDLRARLTPEVKPSELQAFLEENVHTPTRAHPHISVEEVDDAERSNLVLEELARGYTLRGVLLRAARVKVGRSPARQTSLPAGPAGGDPS